MLKGYIENGIDLENVFGIDISKWAIDNAETSIISRVLNYDVKDLDDYPATYDVVSAFDFLEHISKEDVLEVINVLKKKTNKYLVVTLMTEKVDWDNDPTHITIVPLEKWIEWFGEDVKLIHEFNFGHYSQVVFEK